MVLVFLVFAAAIAFGIRALIWRYGWPQFRIVAIPLVAAWFVLTEILAATGVFVDAEAFPPRMAIIVVPITALWISICVSGWGKRFAKAVPLVLLVGAQAFRIPVELFIHELVEAGRMPAMMTWTGANFDIVVGVTAPLVALWISRGKPPRWAVISWNLGGLSLLFNVMIRGILSAPSPLRVIMTEVPNQAVLEFPYIAIPALFVSLAGALHFLAIRKILSR